MSEQKRPSFLVTHPRDKKGNIVANKPYRAVMIGHAEFYEVPKGSHNWLGWNEKPIPKEVCQKYGLLNEKVYPKQVIFESQAALKAHQAKEIAAMEARKNELEKKIAKLGEKHPDILNSLEDDEIDKMEDHPKAQSVPGKLQSASPIKDAEEARKVLKEKTANSSFGAQIKESRSRL